MSCESSMLGDLSTVPPGQSSIDNGEHGIKMLLLKTQVSLTIFLQSEVKIKHTTSVSC